MNWVFKQARACGLGLDPDQAAPLAWLTDLKMILNKEQHKPVAQWKVPTVANVEVLG